MSVRGLSFRTESQAARPTIAQVQRDLFPSFDLLFAMALEHLSCVHQQMFEYRAEAERREESKRAHNQNYGNQ